VPGAHWHVPLVHVIPVQTTQAAPPVPHACEELPRWQVPVASQQPVAQVVGPQGVTQAPAVQLCPAAQAAQTWPPVPQAASCVPG